MQLMVKNPVSHQKQNAIKVNARMDVWAYIQFILNE